MTNSNREKYDQLWSGAWGDMQRLGPVHRRQTEALIKLVTKLNVRTVLDVGCGAGDNLAALAHALPDLVLSGADLSKEALALAAQRVPAASLQELDVQNGKLNQSFDLVMAIQVIEHLDEDATALSNMALMAKQWVLVTTMSGRMRPSEASIGHFRNYSSDDLRKKAAHAGLEVVDIFGWGFPFYSPFYRTMIEWLPGGPPQGKIGAKQQTLASALYHLYALNVPRRGDVITMLARPQTPGR
jgi:2-polyprenyl-3-methyl-5-hydroxy-6-metoxy-1,4-benzoquinol methylase